MKKKVSSKKLKPSFFEKQAWQKKTYLCGIDEVGRGCLSGPLVVAAAILKQNSRHLLLKDSKLLTAPQRDKAYKWITQNCFYSCAIIDSTTIDKKNIYEATRFAMKKTFMQLIAVFPLQKISCVLTDAVPIFLPSSYTHPDLEFYNPTKAESLSPTVAAASIIAKVTRDRLMHKYARLFPQFGLTHHKGYGTKKHLCSIEQHGISIIHRVTFMPKKRVLHYGKSNQKQQSIC